MFSDELEVCKIMKKSQKLAAVIALVGVFALTVSPVVSGPFPFPDDSAGGNNKIASGPFPFPDDSAGGNITLASGPFPFPDDSAGGNVKSGPFPFPDDSAGGNLA